MKTVEQLIAETFDFRGGSIDGAYLDSRLARALRAEHQRAEEAVREMHARELHHFEAETALEEAKAELDRLRAAHAGEWEYGIENVVSHDVSEKSDRDEAIEDAIQVAEIGGRYRQVVRRRRAGSWERDPGFQIKA